MTESKTTNKQAIATAISLLTARLEDAKKKVKTIETAINVLEEEYAYGE